jgi:hypothetical protein
MTRKIDAADPIEVDQQERAVANGSDDFIRTNSHTPEARRTRLCRVAGGADDPLSQLNAA